MIMLKLISIILITIIKEGLSAIVNIHMSDIHWLQASITVYSDGLEIRRALSLALPAFLASAVATSDLQSTILSRGIQIVDKEVELARSLWCSLTTTSTPVGPLQTSQRAWDAPMVVRDCQTVLDNSTSDIDKARLLAVKANHGSANGSLLCRFLPAVFALATILLELQSVFA